MYSQVEATDNLDAGRVKINGNFRATSVIDPETDAVSFQIHQNAVGPDTNNQPIEIVNIGYTGHGATDDIHQNTTGLVRINGRLNLVRNMSYDHDNAKWLTPIQTADAFGSACLEIGGEAVILHATPSGVNFSDVPHEILLAKASGTDGEANNVISSGYFTQSKACIFARFNSTAYDPASTANCWNQVAGTDPLLWLSTAEIKNTENELARFESNSNSAGAYPAIFFAKSRGTLGSRTISVTNEVMGRIGFKAHDGVDFETTAAIQSVTRGTMGSNSVGQELVFLTSPSTTGNLATRMAISHDGTIKKYVSVRQENTSVTTIPVYSSFTAFSPVNTSSTVGVIQQLSTSTGGLRLYGLGSTSTASTARALLFTGILGATSPTAAAVVFQALKNDGANSATDLAATEIVQQVLNNQTTLFEMLGNGNSGFGATGPTALVHIGASTTGRAGLRVVPGPAPSSPNNGDMWIDSTAHTIHVRINGVTKTFTLT